MTGLTTGASCTKAPYTRPRNSTGKTHRFARRVLCEAAEDLGEPTFLIEQRGNREHVPRPKVYTRRVSRQNSAPTEFLAEFRRETRSCVRGLTPIYPLLAQFLFLLPSSPLSAQIPPNIPPLKNLHPHMPLSSTNTPSQHITSPPFPPTSTSHHPHIPPFSTNPPSQHKMLVRSV